jgi:hypothetical protein
MNGYCYHNWAILPLLHSLRELIAQFFFSLCYVHIASYLTLDMRLVKASRMLSSLDTNIGYIY